MTARVMAGEKRADQDLIKSVFLSLKINLDLPRATVPYSTSTGRAVRQGIQALGAACYGRNFSTCKSSSFNVFASASSSSGNNAAEHLMNAQKGGLGSSWA